MKGSIIIIGFFILGTIFGYYHVLPFDLAQTKLSFYTLLVLILTVGIAIGSDKNIKKTFKALNPRVLLLPLCTIIGTLAGVAFISLLIPGRSVSDCMAVGSGFAYYSLSSIIITDFKGPELGTIALMANIMREIFTLLCAPLLAKWFGSFAPISSGGATTMDTTLPIITSVSGKEYAVVSIYHGFLMDFSVPFLVTLFCSI
ncbi:lysine exporter LysO family protein [Falsiporphyromonas endometrii]|uniref:Lysine exporter LysO family protein n=1 Tax=Falsiporphyromonas endometrii TaxID=1387297 RepID=A0ABV9K6Q2_9PORP|nr:lysine exporter LysO family protein [Porphyromonadaceae bacterium]